jgi:arylsulfatase A
LRQVCAKSADIKAPQYFSKNFIFECQEVDLKDIYSMKNTLIRILFFTLISFFACDTKKVNGTFVTTQAKQKYNIILVVADDLGRNDLACYGNTFIETPNLNALAQEGIKCTNGYAAAPLCSPSRASIITGNNPTRINLTEHLHGYSPASPKQKLITPKIETGLPPQLTTIPEVLNNEGYTTAHIGKWHLGSGTSSPAGQGFQMVYGGGSEGLPKTFFYPFFNGKPYPNLLNDTKVGDYLDDALTNKAMQFITKEKDSTFFMELNFYAPHVPIEGKPNLVEKYKNKRTKTGYKGLPEDEYAAMVENIDYNVGRLIKHLKALNLDKKTIVIFTSDNGGLHVQEVPAFAKHTPPTKSDPMKGGKGYVYEGGIKTPWIIWMPAMIKKGREEASIITTDDIFNTCMNLALVDKKSPDGMSLMPIIKGESFKDRPYFLHFPHYSPQRGSPGAVMRKGDFKLIEWYETGEIELYNLKNDEGESTNIAASNAALVTEMKTALATWRKDMGAKMTTPNPNYVGE